MCYTHFFFGLFISGINRLKVLSDLTWNQWHNIYVWNPEGLDICIQRASNCVSACSHSAVCWYTSVDGRLARWPCKAQLIHNHICLPQLLSIPVPGLFEGPGLCCPHLPLVVSMVERRGRVPSAHESGYCIIFCHKLTSSPTESISTSSFPVDTVPAVVNMADGECKICAKFDAINDKWILASSFIPCVNSVEDLHN